MIAAGRAAERGCRVLLLERNPELGRKLLISGGGRCNLTSNLSDRHELTARYGDRGKYLHSLFARFGPDDIRSLLRRYGLETKVEAEQRVFPVTDAAASVRDVLERYMDDGGVTVRRDRRVTGLFVEDGAVRGVVTHRGEEVRATAVFLAVGGASRPETGSTGDGFAWLSELGLPVRRPEASLVPIRVSDAWVRRLQGLALGDAALHAEVLPREQHTRVPDARDRSAWGNARRVYSRRGKVLFTHFGLSGPAVLNAAESIRDLARDQHLRLIVDLLPGYDAESIDRRIRDAASGAGARSVRRVLGDLVSARLVDAVCDVADVDPGGRVAELSRVRRRRLVEALRGMPAAYGGLMGQEKAVVSSGGLDPAAVDFTTMRLREWPSVAVLGDLLDFNRQSGGFSLQVCWASGWVAADACDCERSVSK